MNDSASFALHKQMEAARLLRADLADLVKDDPEFLRDSIEGETNLFECLDALVMSVTEDQALIRGIKGTIGEFQARMERIENRCDMKRSMIAKAMELAEVKKRESPAATVSLRKVPASVIVTDESTIPAKYWKQPPAPPPKLDKKALADALDDGERIEGATLSNGSMTIQIRI